MKLLLDQNRYATQSHDLINISSQFIHSAATWPKQSPTKMNWPIVPIKCFSLFVFCHIIFISLTFLRVLSSLNLLHTNRW